MAMWKLEQLQDREVPQTCINGKWVPARPENFKPKYCQVWRRLRYNISLNNL
jgi:hypothetical protein